MTREATTYRLVEGRGIPVEHFGERVRLTPGEPVRLEQPSDRRRAA